MMRLLGMLVFLMIVVAGIGYFRGWFRAESRNTDGQGTVTVTVDKDKLNQDKADVNKEVHDLAHGK